MKVKLKNLVKIQFGYYERPSEDGTVPYLQAKNFTDEGVLMNNIELFVKEDEKVIESFLQEGDVLFAGKGSRFFAASYKKEWGDVLASSIFYVLSVFDNQILSEYLAVILNLPQNIQYFQQASVGSNILSLRKKELEDFEIEVVSLEMQKKIVEMQSVHMQELRLTEQIIELKKQQYHSAINKILK